MSANIAVNSTMLQIVSGKLVGQGQKSEEGGRVCILNV